MHLGASDPRKNTARVIEAFAALRNGATDRRQLVVAGLSPAAQNDFSNHAAGLGILDDVCLLGFVAEEELVLLYNMAQVVVYPSLYEGFGLPVLEAMACGAPVITSNVSSIPEVAGDAAILIDPTDTAALVQAMTRLADDEVLRRELIARGELQVSKFSWRRAAQETLAIYEEVAQQ
jgi:glycosyltransferase involved in cell wall biosynthesis